MTCNTINIKPVKGADYSIVSGLSACPFCGDESPLLKHTDVGKNRYFYLSCRVQGCVLMQTRRSKDMTKLFLNWNARRYPKLEAFAAELKPFPATPVAEKEESVLNWFKEFFFGKSCS